MQALSKVVPLLEQCENNTMLLKVRLQTAISEQESSKSSKRSLHLRNYSVEIYMIDVTSNTWCVDVLSYIQIRFVGQMEQLCKFLSQAVDMSQPLSAL